MGSTADYFSQLKKYSEANNTPSGYGDWDPAGSLLDLCRKSYRGTALLRLINDENRIPIRLVHGVYDLFEMFPRTDGDGNVMKNEDGSIQYRYVNTYICKAGNYHGIKLSPEDLDLLNKTIEAIEKYKGLVDEEWIDPEDTETGMSVNFRPEITMFWAKLLSLTNEQGNCILSDGKVRLVKHHSATFYQEFCNAVDTKSGIKKDGGAWMENWINRNAGTSDKITSIKTTLSRGFQVQYSFEDGSPFEVTQADLDVCKNLYANLIDVTKFDRDKHLGVIERINKIISTMATQAQSATGITTEAAPQVQTISNEQAASAIPQVPGQVPTPPGVPMPENNGTSQSAASVLGVPPLTPPGSL